MDQLAAVRAEAARRHAEKLKSSEAKRDSGAVNRKRGRKQSAPVRVDVDKTKKSPRAPSESESEGEFVVEEDEEGPSVIQTEYKKMRRTVLKSKNGQVEIKTIDELVNEYLYTAEDTGVFNQANHQAHSSNREQALKGGKLCPDLKELFFAGDLKACRGKGSYVVEVENKEVLVASYYRTVGTKKLLYEAVQLIPKDDVREVLTRINSKIRRGKVKMSQLIERCPALTWNLAYHFDGSLDDALAG
uniref:Uncharacterized protein n=1 Tax=Mucochytrium quahogii TaxID=96639 RepID=A0A7S2S1L7_9STRA|mmetsp:Transcript_6758/g.10688  ORF Transcript_6758/g.10688 Transcript_6758/m.10688 type:complete len:245 (+) Transcript_6758:314-1048(+)|eukprot:CAMPEP_0203755526 /NCGR_PEP_ID=MMETSP0098-20131031/8957_1 /ASSEMBLY_ACC=CAM_ASM_000208 /TAXON_ID=96639 /ORGANISM=" , Strain NY0313808BC1" /LENGTH=244 /DNA_ID=CAMNT_0050647015 /DNA_START=270 /DNA_END=1004 /DNA_ORIENTATION=-